MSDKQWMKADEWTGHAPCGGVIDFIKSPSALGPAKTAAVKATCGACGVRPECITENLRPVTDLKLEIRLPSNSIWVAGQWLPDTATPESRDELTAIKQELLRSLPAEFEARPAALR